MKQAQGVLPRALQVQEMHQAKVRFIPTLELLDDSVVEKIYQAWKCTGKPERVNIYHPVIRFKRRKSKPRA